MSLSAIVLVASLWSLAGILYLIAFNVNRFGRYARESLWMAATYIALAGLLRLLSETLVFTELERRQLLALLAFSFTLILSGLSVTGWGNGNRRRAKPRSRPR